LLREMVREGAVAPHDLDLLKVTDDLDEAMAHVEAHTVERFGLRRVRKPAWWLGERKIQRTGTASTGTSAPDNTR
jgi:hypothetical protein